MRIGPAEPADLEAMVRLLEEMERFYGGEPEPVEERREQVVEALFSERPAAFALLAWDGDELAGIATYSFLWPAVGLTRSLFLKQLHVAATHQGRGVGRRLMDEILDLAARERCSRVEWATDADNHAARRFYAELGFTPFPSKVLYRVTRPSR